jgi:hypothetical protein
MSATNITSKCRIASIAPDDAMILRHDANPGRMKFSARTGHHVFAHRTWPCQNRRVQQGIEIKEHAMPLSRNGYVIPTRRRFSGALFSALLALALFDPSAASAQKREQIKLTEKHIQGFMGARKDMTKLYDGANPDKPNPKVEVQAEAARKNGFASLDEYDEVSFNILMIMSGIDPQTKKFTEPPEHIKKEIAALKAEKTIPAREKKKDLMQLEAALKTAKPIQFKGNIALVLKYYNKLLLLMSGRS